MSSTVHTHNLDSFAVCGTGLLRSLLERGRQRTSLDPFLTSCKHLYTLDQNKMHDTQQERVV